MVLIISSTILSNLLVYILWLLCILLYVMVKCKNPIMAIFMFILLSIAIFLFLILMGAEFLALLVLIIYTGVIAVLFLFTVIIYDLDQMHVIMPRFWGLLGYWVTIVFSLRHCGRLLAESTHNAFATHVGFNSIGGGFSIDIFQLNCLFNKHGVLFLACGLLLFIAIIGSVVITYSFAQSIAKK